MSKRERKRKKGRKQARKGAMTSRPGKRNILKFTTEPLLMGKTQYGSPPLLTCLDQLLFVLEILFTFFTKQAS